MGFEGEPLLVLRNIEYSRRGQLILKNVNFDLWSGEIHAVVGEHRAGKTPLTQIITGDVRRDSGGMFIGGKAVENFSPAMAIRHHIGVVHQEPQVLLNLSAVENIIAGTMPPGRITTKYYAAQVSRVREIFRALGRELDLSVPLSRLPAADLPIVEIARMIYLDCEIIVMDDVGMRLTPGEMKTVLKYLRRFRDEGKGVLFIDSDVDNVLAIADRVTSLHNGFVGGTENVKDLDRLKLLKLTYNFALNIQNEAEDPLVMSRHYDENVIADLPAGVLIFDFEGRLSTVNRAAGEILGHKTRDLQSCSIDQLIGPSVLSGGRELVSAVRSKETRSWKKMTLRGEKLAKVRTFPYRDAERMVRGSVVLLEDITADHTVKEYLVRAEKISTVAQLAAGVSHEINNPLGIITNYLHTLRRRDLDGDVRDKLERISTQMDRIQEITGSLLSFSRFQGFSEGELNIKQLLEEVLTLLNHRIDAKNITVHRDFSGNRVIKGNGNRLRQVFVNLLSNSIEAVSERGMLELALRWTEPYAEVSIRDDGVGIPPDVRDKIFTPFFSTKLTKENAGLGLSLCQHIVEGHKGMITFDSKPGSYTEFRVLLPA